MVANAPTLLAQIDTELQSIQAKLRDGTATGSDLGALIATLVANIATTQTVMTALNLSTGNGLGVIADVPLDDNLHTWIAAAIVTETP